MKKKIKKAKTKAKAKTKPKAKTKKTLRAKAKPKSTQRAKPKTKKKKSEKPKLTFIPPPNSVDLGRVDDYYAHIGVIAFTVKGPLRVGDHLHIMGHTTNLEMTVDSMQINHQPVTEAKATDAVGIKVNSRVRRGDHVFRIKG